MSFQRTIIVVDDNRSVLSAVSLLLRPHFANVITLPSPVRLEESITREHPACVLLDMNFSTGINNGNEGLFWLGRLKKRWPELPVVLFTAYADIDVAVRGLKEGAADFIVKPWDNRQLIQTLTGAADQKGKSHRSVESSMLWGESAPMTALKTLVEKVAPTDANILITGENGTGKEMLAREIHALSARSRKPMVTVDMGAIAPTLFESELFGHVRGAFTGAASDRKGKLEDATGSSLFMDEIGNMPLTMQAKLLSVLQSRQVIPVGSNKPVDIDIRLICATNCDPARMVADGSFREDLLYRINTIHLEIPPLRQRPADIMPLAYKFVADFCMKYAKAPMTISAGAQSALLSHPWYGNIRELQHAVEKAVIIAEGTQLLADHFSLNNRTTRPPSAAPDEPVTLEDMERKMIADAIERCQGNLTAVASRLGITRQTLYNKMKKFGL